jgi:beta-lactamase regulating signal transducer with metallopeptidase domain
MIAAFISHLWQSTVFAGVAWLVALSLRSHGASIRHSVWLVASLKFLVPFALLTMLGSELRTLLTPTATPQLLVEFGHQALRPFQLPTFAASATQATSSSLPVVLACIWVAGAFVIGRRRAREWWAGQEMLRGTSKLSSPDLILHGALDIRSAPHLHEPAVIGVVRPTVLLPEGVASVLESSELKAVLAHEAAHIERRDNFTATLHMLVETLFWFHPLVWWIGARLLEERERACDEAVMRRGASPLEYARAILKICRFYVRSTSPHLASVSGSELERRIGRILHNASPARLSVVRKCALASSIVAALCLPLIAGIAPAQPSVLHPFGGPPLVLGGVSIHSSAAHDGPEHWGLHDGRYKMLNTSFEHVLSAAYNVHYDLIDGPTWLKSSHYDIAVAGDFELKAGAETNHLCRQVAQALASKLRVRTHYETRAIPTWTLVVASPAVLERAKAQSEKPRWSTPSLSSYLSMRFGHPVMDDALVAQIELHSSVDLDRVPKAELVNVIAKEWGIELKQEPRTTVLVIDSIERPYT